MTRAVPERLILAAVFLTISLWGMIGQRPARLIADGTQYHAMAMQYAAGESVVTAEAPFVMRIATPWLASQLDPLVSRLLPGRIALHIENANGLKGFPGFYAVNILASFATTVLLFYYLRIFVTTPWLRLLLMTLWMIQWHGPVRFTYFYPSYVDPLFVAFLMAGLLVTERSHDQQLARSAVVVSALTFVAAFSRETALLIPLLFGARHWRWLWHSARARDVVWVLLPWGAGLLALVLVQELTIPDRPYDPFATPRQMLREKPLFTWLLAWFFGFGPAALAVVLAAWAPVSAWLHAHPHHAIFLTICGVLAFFGGTDTERILVWAWPVMLVLLASAIMHHLDAFARAPLLAAALAFVALLSARIFWAVPAGIDDEVPLSALDLSLDSFIVILDKTIVMNNYYANLWSFFGSRALHAAQLALDLALTAGGVVLIRRYSPRS